MRGNEYQIKANRTLNYDLTPDENLINAALGLSGESGEINDLIKKWKFHGHGLDRDKLRLELGDLLWYISQACVALDLTMEDVMHANIAKLEKRYPDKFSSERSINRED